ncbi:MAG: beta-glucosidase [Ilumatobacteraceae bacterium]
MQFDDGVSAVRAGESGADDIAAELAAELTDAELLGVLDGDETFLAGIRSFGRDGYNHEPIVAGRVERLGIPGIRFTDGPRGVVMGRSTCFPVSMARGATWDTELETEIGAAIGVEGRAQGANLFAGVCVNLLRHPAWGRAQETYGEDPVHLGAMGAALTRGVREQLMACVKHFALNSMENARFQVDVSVAEDVLHEVYLPHFKRIVDDGADAVMSAYNSVNGEWCGDSAELLTTILRDEWSFEGFVMSDFIFGHRDPVGSVSAGLELEMPFRQQRARALPAALEDGSLRRTDAVRAARRLISAQLRWAASVPDDSPSWSVVASAAHRALARRTASQSMVLLRNEDFAGRPLLPLDPHVERVAVIGALAAARNLGDHGSSAVRPPAAVTILDGLRAGLDGVTILDDDGADVDRATAVARSCDVAVIAVGYTAADEGEALASMDRDTLGLLPAPLGSKGVTGVASNLFSLGARSKGSAGGDRVHLGLRPEDEELITSVAAVNPRTVVVVIAGSAVLMESWRHRVPAIVLAWYSGMEGGHALTDVLAGDVEPGGRLPFAMAADEDHLPHFDREARSITYDRWWGQRRLDRDQREPAYPLGFGLGYTTIDVVDVADVAADVGALHARATVTVRNVGDRSGATVVQLYACGDAGPHRPVRQLVGFARVSVEPGAMVATEIEADLRPLATRNRETHEWSIVPADYRLEAARFSGDPDAISAPLDLGH